MNSIVDAIKSLSRDELEEVMKAVEAWFAENHPDWDVVYMALPKEPVERKQRLEGVLRLMAKDLAWNEKEFYKHLDG